jgi:hypothetical protein
MLAQTVSASVQNLVLVNHALYLVVSVALTIWVARTLHRNGRAFLIDAFHGDERLADSVNHLLVVGFYLVNLGFVVLGIRFGAHPTNQLDAVELLAAKVGTVLLVLGAMHFLNLRIFSSMRRRALVQRDFANTPPLANA